MSKEEKSEAEREMDEQSGIMSEERRAELRRKSRERRGNGEIDVAFDRIEWLETIVRNIRKFIQAEQYKQVKDVFVDQKSPLERIPLFKKLDIKIRQIDYGISFRTTESGLVYEINDRVFTTIYPQINALKIEYYIPYGWESCKLTDDSEIDEVIVLIKESCDFIREKTK